MSSESEVIEYK